jgi:hypothetical protein
MLLMMRCVTEMLCVHAEASLLQPTLRRDRGRQAHGLGDCDRVLGCFVCEEEMRKIETSHPAVETGRQYSKSSVLQSLAAGAAVTPPL